MNIKTLLCSAILVAGLFFTGASNAQAQGPGGPGDRFNPDAYFNMMDLNGDGSITKEEFTQARENRQRGGEREANQNRRGPGNWTARLKADLGATDEEWTALEPMIQKVGDLRRQMMAGRFGFGGRRGGGNVPPDDQEVMTEVTALRQAVDAPSTNTQVLKTKVEALKTAREKKQAELKETQNALREVVTLRQEAILMLSGILD